MLDKREKTIQFDIKVDDHFTRHLPADPESKNIVRQVEGACYSWVTPARVSQPRLLACSKHLAARFGFPENFYRSDVFLNTFSGNHLMPGMKPYAMCYGGHQFGSWAGQLGDGRAINLGEVTDTKDSTWTLQLKGAGLTPYSRNADGFAVLRSSIREFLCSEAMYHLNVPTTRALSLVTTGEKVMRDMFYDGHPKMEPGAIVCRAAPSFVRFGNFEILAARNEHALLRQLADYVIASDFSDIDPKSSYRYEVWFKKVCELTADMIVDWMRVGFVHGVMNTDNMSILGLTIDYGPYGWLEDYDPSWTPNTTDAGTRRYCFGNQPGIAQWNLTRFANAILSLVQKPDGLQQSIEQFGDSYQERQQAMMFGKLGLDPAPSYEKEMLVKKLPTLLSVVETDMTIFFRQLSELNTGVSLTDPDAIRQLKAPIQDAYYRPEQQTPAFEKEMDDWLKEYVYLLKKENMDPKKRCQSMNRVNPRYVLRNYMAQMAIEQTQKGDLSILHELMKLLEHPYDEQPGMEKWGLKRPDWARNKPGCSMLSCSS